LHIEEGDWFGSRSVDPEGTKNLAEKPPVVWLPQDEIGNSPSTPSYINIGPFKNQMIHGEVTHGGVKRVFVDEVEGQLQGAVFRFIQGLEAGVNRIVWGPDNALYVGGIGSTGNWGHSGKLHYGLQRVKYNGKSTMEMLAIRAMSNGIEIEFTEPLRDDAWDKDRYQITQFYYQPTENYGGPKLGEKRLGIQSVHLSDDRKKVFIHLSGMKENHVLYVYLPIPFTSQQGNALWSSEAWYTMNKIPKGKN
jgi:cytochrome c